MILYKGKIFETDQQDHLIRSLDDDIKLILRSGLTPRTDEVIFACDALAARILAGKYDDIVRPFLESFNVSDEYFRSLCDMFSKAGLTRKLSVELSDKELLVDGRYLRKRYPLGVLLHIAAGNFAVLPAYSVVEGLLAGNINILKLPAGDSGLSVLLLSELIKICPSLAEFIFVFDVPSTETESLVKLASLADGIAVWGGDAAVAAARKIAPVNSKIISWGHKLSFAYCTPDAPDNELKKLASSICMTNQTLCSSCQGIFVDTSSDEELASFGERFFEILKGISSGFKPADLGMRAKNAINMYNEGLEQHKTGSKIFFDEGVSVIVKHDSELELSYMYRSVWVKKLLSDDICLLHKHKNHLQTAAVIVPDKDLRESICEKLISAGVVRIASAGNMSRSIPGEAHDGTYALREYSRIVETEFF